MEPAFFAAVEKVRQHDILDYVDEVGGDDERHDLVAEDVELGVERVENKRKVARKNLKRDFFHHDAVFLPLHSLVVLPAGQADRELGVDFDDHVNQDHVGKGQSSAEFLVWKNKEGRTRELYI